MKRAQFSLLTLVTAVFFVAVACAALRPSALAASALFTGALILLAIAVLGGAYQAGEARAFWRGFAGFGLGYFVLVLTPALEQNIGERLFTTQLLRDMRDLREWVKAAMPSAAERQIHAKLAMPVSLEFVETPISDIVDFLRDYTGVNFLLDRVALENEGVTSDTPVTIHVEQIPLKSALHHLLRQLNLTYKVENDVVLITAVVPSVGSPTEMNAMRIGHSLMAMLFAFIGGVVARFFFQRSSRADARGVHAAK